MKFADVYRQAAFAFLKEEEQLNPDEQLSPEAQPQQVSDEITSGLPDEETIDLNEEKYKTLLLALKKALEGTVKDDLEKRKVISDIDVDGDPKTAEEQLIALLNAESSEFPQKQ